MNEMYDMSIVTHNYGVMTVLGVILINIFMLFGIKNLAKYTRAMSLFTPIGSTVIGVVIFTGIVMMASKHLDFTVQNIVMIIFAVIFILIEVKRSLNLKNLNKNDERIFKDYKIYALKLMLLEIFLILTISFWMLF
ncbi:MAG: hypothetical protein A2513_10780 [Sulfurimonas sp. RIFOXYD12_FULL_33_39]|uniref:hypothetical protein n=1 Tax=unclassified Sulfurimonas TaxID=2623549 RepID=UPI0008B23EF3|nr:MULTISPECIES: hypothetical protein [unclassified Sulfurimonas]OHE05815.1 MAG: hypothetical protein A3G74_09540 [Sulfurimonas sp. RIFCSPLOWO2_12_FULL_34_6]OHE09791.1 MAG: hypothetical protein A2513_10780 [Sulfurimonas sp. RIFOXYD12_FULL_33_39]OHE13701.1 MAG: hypothetical protein A2530_08975 [Sulfurimonas sp. RIFOXYD2_FULL_34_21]DAB28084.1 MAG TPA: hypothetical protein CFH78_04275 [Sulfurimonas sp. UBA10385]